MSKKRFYFKVENKLYSIKYSSLILIPYFHTIAHMNPTESLDANHAIDVPVINHNGLRINTARLFDIVVRYINHWEKKIKRECYIKEDRVQEGFIHQILQPFDLKLIQEYIDEEVKDLINDDHTHNVYIKISACNILLAQVDAYLHMNGLANKIYAYIVCLLRECFMDDMEKIQNNEYFTKLQADTASYWKNKYGSTYS